MARRGPKLIKCIIIIISSIIIIIWYGCLLLHAFSSWHFSWTSSDPHRSGIKLHTAVLSVLCVMFQVWLSFVMNLSNVFLVQFPNFFLKLLVTIPVAPIITGTIVYFRFHIRCISIHKLLYFIITVLIILAECWLIQHRNHMNKNSASCTRDTWLIRRPGNEYPEWIFRYFPWFLQENTWVVLHIQRRPFLPRPFSFIIKFILPRYIMGY